MVLYCGFSAFAAAVIWSGDGKMGDENRAGEAGRSRLPRSRTWGLRVAEELDAGGVVPLEHVVEVVRCERGEESAASLVLHPRYRRRCEESGEAPHRVEDRLDG